MTAMTWEARQEKYRRLHQLDFTKEEKARWEPMLHATWQAIGGDAESAMAEAGERMTKGIIVELVCDANRVQQYGGMTDEEYEFLSAIYNRPSVQRWLRKVLNYC